MKVKNLIRKNLIYFIVGPLVKMIEAVFDLLIPLFMKAVIDKVKGTPDAISKNLISFIDSFGTWINNNDTLNSAIIGGTIILVMGIIGFLTTMVCQFIAAHAATKIGSELRETLYQNILTLSKKDIENFGNSKLITILNSDTYQVQQGVLFFIRLGVRAPFIILGSLVLSFILNWQIGLIFLAIIPLILFIVFFVMRKSSKKYLHIQSELDDLSTKTSDTINGYKVIRAFNREEYENQKFNELNENYKKDAIKVSKINALINPLTFAIVTLATIAVIYVGGFQMNKGIMFNGSEVMPSTLITLVSYLATIFQTLVLLTSLILIFTKSIVASKRCNEALQLKPTVKDIANPITKDINTGEEIFFFEHVNMGYITGGNNALTDITFSLKKGEQLGIIGPTGSGKSTLINMMERFLDADSGTVFYKGVDIKNYSLKALRNELALVPQKSNLFKGTIKSNMLMANSNATDEEINKALALAKADEFVKDYDDKLDHPVMENGNNFSGGQRQRLCIARGIIKNPEVLILDDSTSALDLLTDKTVRDNISNEFKDLTKVIISQRIATIKDSDLILVFEGGQIIAKGKHEELLANCPSYLETYESQMQKGE